MVPTHLRWLEVDAPDVLPSATRAHRFLLWGYLPLVAIASIALYLFTRRLPPEVDPVVFAGGVFLVVWLVVFVPPAVLGLPVALMARRALAGGSRSAESRRRLRTLAVLHGLLVAFALVAIVPCGMLVVAAIRQHLGAAT